jgi:hypothetical protein
MPGYARGDETHHAGLTTVDGGKGLRARVLNGGDGILVGGDNSRELMQLRKREGSAMAHSDLDRRARRGRAVRGVKRSMAFEPGRRKWGKTGAGRGAHKGKKKQRESVAWARRVEGGGLRMAGMARARRRRVPVG